MKKAWKYVTASSVAFAMMFLASHAYAAGIESTKLASGTKRLIEDITEWLMGISIPAGALWVGYYFFRKQGADEQDEQRYVKKIKVVIWSTIGAVAGAGALNFIVSYYK